MWGSLLIYILLHYVGCKPHYPLVNIQKTMENHHVLLGKSPISSPATRPGDALGRQAAPKGHEVRMDSREVPHHLGHGRVKHGEAQGN